MKDNLILKVSGNKYINRSFFKPTLSIYEDTMTYRKRSKLVKVDEITMLYNHVVRVSLHKGLVFSTIEIIMSGGDESVRIKGIWNKKARKAKKVIDKKVHQSHNESINSLADIHIMDTFEKTLSRLNELFYKKKLSKKEYETKKSQLLKSISQ